MQQNELPEGWVETSLLFAVGGDTNQIVGGPFGSNLKVDDYQQNGIPIIRLQNIGYREFIEKDIKFISLEKAEELKYHSFVKGDLVLAKLGTPIGKTCEIPDKYDWGIVVSDVVRIRIQNGIIEKKFLLHYLNSGMALSQLNKQVFGTTRPRVNLKEVRDLQVLLPPLPEQHRIVAAIEALFARLNATNERLDRVPGIMKAFRQAVLAAACDGRLTEDWREENQVVEGGTKLINRIHENRLEISKGSGKSKTIPQIYTEIDTSDFPNIPISWTWATLDQLVKEGRPIIYGIIKPGPHISDGVPYVRVNEMSNGEISDISSLKRTSIEIAKRFSRATLHSGDLLISKDGTIGKVAIVPPELEGGNINQHIVRASIHSFIDKSYIVNSIRSPRTQKWLDQEKKGVALQGVNVEDFRRLPLPIPPLPEQQEIVRRVDALFAFADSIEAKVVVAREKTEKLRQSILAKAFSGELVPTEAELARQEGRDYESAEVLLKRIKAEGKSGKK